MQRTIAPTKGNLLATKKSLRLARMGFDLLDRKRNVLIREMMALLGRAEEVQQKIDDAYAKAYLSLQHANIAMGSCEQIAGVVPVDKGLSFTARSVMGVEIPMVALAQKEETFPPFGLYGSSSALDEAYEDFAQVKRLTTLLAEVETSVYRLADAVKKIQKRANALKNIVIPQFEGEVKFIMDALEEKDREDFSRLKVIKQRKK